MNVLVLFPNVTGSSGIETVCSCLSNKHCCFHPDSCAKYQRRRGCFICVLMLDLDTSLQGDVVSLLNIIVSESRQLNYTVKMFAWSP